MLGGKAAPVHAVLVDGGDALIGEAFHDLAQTLEALCLVLILAPRLLRVGHDADHRRAKAFHAWDGAGDLGERDGEIGRNLFPPVADRRAELGDCDTRGVEFGGGGEEILLRHVVDIHVADHAGGDGRPAQVFCGADLEVDVAGGFVGEAGESFGGKHEARLNFKFQNSNFNLGRIRASSPDEAERMDGVVRLGGGRLPEAGSAREEGTLLD